VYTSIRTWIVNEFISCQPKLAQFKHIKIKQVESISYNLSVIFKNRN